MSQDAGYPIAGASPVHHRCITGGPARLVRVAPTIGGMSKPWSIWKDIGYPGTVHVPGGGGRTLRYDFTADDWRRIVRTGKSKVAAGWSIPLAWEHQPVGPSRNPDRDFALGIFGDLADFDLTPDGRAKALLRGTDPADLEQLKKVRFVSPQLDWDWRDTDGKVWRGPSVTHLAATGRPVQRHQHPVGTDPDRPHPGLTRVNSLESLVRMSLGTGAKNAPGVGRRLCLSLDHYTRPPGITAMADEATTLPGGDKKKSPWERAAEALAMIGVKIGDGSNIKDADHFADLCEVACMNSGKNQDADDLPPEEDADPDAIAGDMDAPPEGASEPPPPVQMSLVSQKLVDRHRADLVKRAERLGEKGCVPPVVSNDLAARAKKVRLSLTANAELAPTSVATEIAAYEKLPAGKAWTGKAPKPDPKAAKGKKPAARLSLPANTAEAEPSPYEETSPGDDDAVVSAFEDAVGRGK